MEQATETSVAQQHTSQTSTRTSANIATGYDYFKGPAPRPRTVELQAPEPGTYALEHAFDRAAASPWESAWERVVQDAAKKPTFSKDEIGWLLGRSLAASGAGYRFAETLARVLGLVAERHEAYRPLVAVALAALFRHELPSVRIATLEAMLEVNVKSAKLLARRVGADAHPALREAADAVLAMTG